MKTFILIFIFALGFFLRAQETLSGNFLFLKDQGRDMLAVKSIVADRKLTLIGPYTGLQAVFQGPLYYYLLAVPFIFSDGNPRAVMWLMVGGSMLAILLAYLLGKRFYSETTGIIAAFLFAVSPSASAAATFIWSPLFILPIMTAEIYFFFAWTRDFSQKNFLLWVSILGLMFHFEIAFAAPFTFVMFILGWLIARQKKEFFPITWFGVIITLFLSPLIFFDFRHNHLTVRSLLSLLEGNAQGLAGGEVYAKIMRDHLVNFIINLKSTFITQEPFDHWFAFVMLFGAIFYLLRGAKLINKILIAIPAWLFVTYLMYPFQLYDWYLVGLFPVYLLLGAIFLSWLWQHKLGRLVVISVIILLLQHSFMRLQRLYTKPDYGGTAKIKGKVEAIDAIYRDGQGRQFNLLVFTPVVLTDAYDYLLWWYGQRTYGYLPGKEKRETLYLLIEPDPAKPWTYQGWLETEIKVGKINKTRTLPSGFIIQKRQI